MDPDLQNRLSILKEMPERNSAAAEQGRAKFLLQAKRMRASLSEPVSWLERFRVFLDGLRLKPQPVINWAVAVIVAMVLFFGGSSATVYASQASLPGEPLYPLKLMSENSRLLFTISPAARVNLSMDLADRRVDEISRLQNAGRPVPQQVVDRLMNEVNQSLEVATKMKDAQMLQSLAVVSSRVGKQIKVLDSLMAGKTVPPAVANIHSALAQLESNIHVAQADPQAFRVYVQTQIRGGVKPTETPTYTPTSTETLTPTETMTGTETATATGTPTPSQTPTSTLTNSPSATLTPTPTQTPTKTRTIRTRRPTHTPRQKPNGLY
jgi:hypothetical protein